MVSTHAKVAVCDGAAKQVDAPPFEAACTWFEGAENILEREASIAKRKMRARAPRTQESSVRIGQMEVTEPRLESFGTLEYPTPRNLPIASAPPAVLGAFSPPVAPPGAPQAAGQRRGSPTH